MLSGRRSGSQAPEAADQVGPGLGHRRGLLGVPDTHQIPSLTLRKGAYSPEGSAGGLWTALLKLGKTDWPACPARRNTCSRNSGPHQTGWRLAVIHLQLPLRVIFSS